MRRRFMVSAKAGDEAPTAWLRKRAKAMLDSDTQSDKREVSTDVTVRRISISLKELTDGYSWKSTQRTFTTWSSLTRRRYTSCVNVWTNHRHRHGFGRYDVSVIFLDDNKRSGLVKPGIWKTPGERRIICFQNWSDPCCASRDDSYRCLRRLLSLL
jgi:hypothetical protein